MRERDVLDYEINSLENKASFFSPFITSGITRNCFKSKLISTIKKDRKKLFDRENVSSPTLIQWFVLVLMTLIASCASLELMLKRFEQLLALSERPGLEER